jgi:hypothetical protein
VHKEKSRRVEAHHEQPPAFLTFVVERGLAAPRGPEVVASTQHQIAEEFRGRIDPIGSHRRVEDCLGPRHWLSLSRDHSVDPLAGHACLRRFLILARP